MESLIGLNSTEATKGGAPLSVVSVLSVASVIQHLLHLTCLSEKRDVQDALVNYLIGLDFVACSPKKPNASTATRSN